MEITPIRAPWKGTMTARERFNRQMHFQSVDRCFHMEFGYWEENYSQWALFRDRGITTEAQANTLFSFDPIRNVSGTVFMSPPFEHRELGVQNGKRLIQNAEGLIAEVPMDGHSTIPHFIKSAIETPEDWEKVKKERFDPDDPSRKVDIAALKASLPTDDQRDFPLGVDCGSMIGRIRDILTFEGVCYTYYDYPEMLEDMVERCCVLVETFLDQVLPNVRFDYASGWEDICYNKGPILPVAFFRDVLRPRYRRIRDKLEKYGIDLWYTDCDGDVRPILPHLMDGGINCLFPFEVNSCTHPAKLLAEYPELRIMGGVDKMALGAGRAAIDEYLQSIAPCVARGGYIPFCDHRCPPNVKEDDYLYYLDRKEAMFGMR